MPPFKEELQRRSTLVRESLNYYCVQFLHTHPLIFLTFFLLLLNYSKVFIEYKFSSLGVTVGINRWIQWIFWCRVGVSSAFPLKWQKNRLWKCGSLLQTQRINQSRWICDELQPAGKNHTVSLLADKSSTSAPIDSHWVIGRRIESDEGWRGAGGWGGSMAPNGGMIK